MSFISHVHLVGVAQLWTPSNVPWFVREMVWSSYSHFNFLECRMTVIKLKKQSKGENKFSLKTFTWGLMCESSWHSAPGIKSRQQATLLLLFLFIEHLLLFDENDLNSEGHWLIVWQDVCRSKFVRDIFLNFYKYCADLVLSI